MAEITSAAAHSHKPGVRRSKKNSTRVDLTPMVDLGFLLITFFIFTTTMSRPRATHLNMPADGNSSVLSQDAALTLVALNDDKVFYYQGQLEEAMKNGSYGTRGYALRGGIGDIIREKQTYMDQHYHGGRKDLMLLIKPTGQSSYRNVVQLLDEATINQIGRYALMDITPEEETEAKKLAIR